MATMMMSPSALDAAEDGDDDEVVVSAGGCFTNHSDALRQPYASPLLAMVFPPD